MNIVPGYLVEMCNSKVIDINYVKEHFDELAIKGICIDEYTLISDKKIIYTDLEHPLVVADVILSERTLCIDSTYYNEHKKEIDELILFICQNYKDEEFKISSSDLINIEMLKVIASNPNIKRVNLGDRNDIVYLSKEMYDILNNGRIEKIVTYGVNDDLKDNFDPIIGYNERFIVENYTYESLTKTENCFINKSLKEDELYYLKYLNKNSKIRLSSKDYENVFLIINRLRECGFEGPITIEIGQKNDFNEYLFSHLDLLKDTRNIKVYSFLITGLNNDLLTYIKYERRLIDMVLPAMNLSPFEKYLYAYNVVKQFKKYKESEDKTSARNLYQLLDNEYMVCVGYSNLLGDLLDKLGIENCEYSQAVDVGLDYVPKDAVVLPDKVVNPRDGKEYEVETRRGDHARREIHLVDPKYGIDGYYLADPTWDNDMQNDTYNYALMTQDEYIGTDRYNYFKRWGIDELFFVHSLEEFYLKINILLDKNKNKKEKDIIEMLLSKFSDLDKEFYEQIIAKYPKINSFRFDYTKEIIQDVFLMIGEHILEKTNNLVDGNKFKEGITVYYQKIKGLSSEELERKVAEVMEVNKKRHAICFPKRYKVDRDENTLAVFNATNKFDLDEEAKLDM